MSSPGRFEPRRPRGHPGTLSPREAPSPSLRAHARCARVPRGHQRPITPPSPVVPRGHPQTRSQTPRSPRTTRSLCWLAGTPPLRGRCPSLPGTQPESKSRLGQLSAGPHPEPGSKREGASVPALELRPGPVGAPAGAGPVWPPLAEPPGAAGLAGLADRHRAQRRGVTCGKPGPRLLCRPDSLTADRWERPSALHASPCPEGVGAQFSSTKCPLVQFGKLGGCSPDRGPGPFPEEYGGPRGAPGPLFL